MKYRQTCIIFNLFPLYYLILASSGCSSSNNSPATELPALIEKDISVSDVSTASSVTHDNLAIFTPVDGSLFKSFTADFGHDFQDTNICSSKSIFGINGSASCFNFSQARFSDSTNGSLNNDGTIVSFTPNPGLAFNQFELDLGNDYQASNICSTKTIFGLSGTANCLTALTRSISSKSEQSSGNPTTAIFTATDNTGYSSVTINLGADFLDSNICKNKSIFGLSGTANCLSSTLTQVVSNRTDASNSSSTSPIFSPSSGSGYSAFTVDLGTDFQPTNICSGKTIFGLSGSANCLSASTLTVSNMSGASSSTSNEATYIAKTGSVYNSFTINMGADFEVNNFCNNKTIMGQSGTAQCSNQLEPLTSTAHRTKGVLQITQKQLTAGQNGTTYSPSPLPSGYRSVTNINLDNNGKSGTSVTFASRPTVDCGIGKTTLTERIDDCAVKNREKAFWNGTTSGHAGQSNWNLVTRSGANNEVWRDSRTGLIWSSLIRTKLNWCQAAGNIQTNDPKNICNNSNYQPEYEKRIARSACEETGTAPALSGDGTGPGGIWNTQYHPVKGGLGANSTPSVRWRLPTSNDYKQADIDGIQFVMPVFDNEWTATLYSSSGWPYAITFVNSLNGSSNRYTLLYLRCVGY